MRVAGLTSVLGTAAVLTLAIACRTPAGSKLDAADAAGNAFPVDVTKIVSLEQFKQVSKDSSGIIKTGRTVKFLIDNRNNGTPKVHFINANFLQNNTTPDFAKFHYYFGQHSLNVTEQLDDFNKNTYFTNNKRYYAGTLQTYFLGDATEPVYGVSFYPQDFAKEQQTLDVVKMVRAAFVPGLPFAFVETGSQQTVKESDVVAAYAQEKIQLLSIEKILGTIKYLPMHQGEAFGYLRIFPESQDDLTAADIAVFDDLPLDLTVVAGTITRAYQDTNSHVNLKSKERNTPNAVLRDADPTSGVLAEFKDKPVRLVIGAEGFTIEPTTPEIIKERLAARLNKPWVPITWESTTKILSYNAMCPLNPADCLKLGRKYGSKAANLGFMANRRVLGRVGTAGTLSNRLGYDLVPVGFGLPLSFYKSFVDNPANATLKQKLKELITKEKTGLMAVSERVQRLKEVQGLFYAGKFPAGMLEKIKTQLATDLPGIEKVKVRSSANAEDIEGFDGAGLHDSYSAKPDSAEPANGVCKREEDAAEEGGGETKAKMKPKSIGCGIKGVFASLWNKRAIEERSFSRIDHATIAMGISILPAYDFESPVTANAVVVTRVLNTSDVFGYTLSSQKGNNLVTNPDPGTYTEVTIAAIGVGAEPTSLTVTRFAKPKRDEEPLTTTVFDHQTSLDLVTITKAVEEAYCRAKPGYYSGDCRFVSVDTEKPKSLDMELKYLENGHFVCKQAREFSGH